MTMSHAVTMRLLLTQACDEAGDGPEGGRLFDDARVPKYPGEARVLPG